MLLLPQYFPSVKVTQFFQNILFWDVYVFVKRSKSYTLEKGIPGILKSYLVLKHPKMRYSANKYSLEISFWLEYLNKLVTLLDSY